MEHLKHSPTPGSDQLKLLIDSVVDYGVYMVDADGIIVSWNAGAEKLSGYRADEIVGRPFALMFTDEDRKNGVPADNLARARDAGRFECEGWRIRKDGARFWAHSVMDAVRDDDGKVIGFAKVTRDITDRHAAEEALIDSERQFRRLVNGIVDYSLFMLDPCGVITTWNAGAERIKGYRADEIVGVHFSRFFTDQDRAAGKPAESLEIAARLGRYETEGWRVRKNGSHFWASVVIDVIRDEAGDLLGFAKITRDMTERRAAQEAIRQSERQFRLLTNGVTDCALYMIDLNGVVVSWNTGAQKLKGFSADEIIGAHFSKFYSESDRLAGVPGRALHAASENGKYSAEGWRVRKDGTMFWASVVIELIRDEQGVPVGYAKLTRDVTERRNARAALETAREQLLRSQKMESLGKLTAGLAHDFNNLLMIIGSHAQILGKRPLQEEKVARAVDAIRTATQRGAGITRQLLAFSRQQPLNPTAIDLTQRVDALRDLLSSSAGPLVDLKLSFPAHLWAVEADINELDLALVNLAINARDAMQRGGQIVVSAENVVLRDGGSEGTLSGEFVAVTVADPGVGIPADILPKIFDPFFTTKDVGKGTGLGLSQVYGFAQQSGGSVTVTSTVGLGTRITLLLPRVRLGASAGPAEPATIIEGSVGNVLVVDDHPDVATASANLVEELGYTAVVVGSADAALTLLEQRQDFSLVFSDIVMPGTMNGLGLARTIRERHPQIPILLATGFSPADQGNDDFPVIRKPYELAELARAIAVVTKKPMASGNLVDLGSVRRERGTQK